MPLSSERYYVGSVSDSTTTIFLSSDMTNAGVPAKIELSGEDAFDDITGETVTEASDGNIHTQAIIAGVVGVRFEIKILFCPEALFAALVSMLEGTRGTNASVRVHLTSVKREIDVQAIANGNGWLSTGKFSGSVIQDVVTRLISTGAGGA
jgi:hypothetical protein